MRNCHMLLYQEAGCVLIHLPKERETIMKGYMFMFLCYFSVFHVFHYILQRLSTLIKKNICVKWTNWLNYITNYIYLLVYYYLRALLKTEQKTYLKYRSDQSNRLRTQTNAWFVISQTCNAFLICVNARATSIETEGQSTAISIRSGFASGL